MGELTPPPSLEAWTREAEGRLLAGDVLAAFDGIQGALKVYPKSPELRHQMARALIKLGVPTQALATLEDLAHEPETCGLRARAHKDLWLLGGPETSFHLGRACYWYEEAARSGDALWGGTNLATLYLASGRPKEARDCAAHILAAPPQATFWSRASRVEALAVLGSLEEAAAELAAALPGVPREQQLSLRRNLRLLAPHLDMASLDACFPEVLVGYLGSGHTPTSFAFDGLKETVSGGRTLYAVVLVPTEEASVRLALRSHEAGAALHLVLPWEAVAMTDWWAARGLDAAIFRRLLAQAQETHALSAWPGFADALALDHASRVADGLAAILAQQLEGTVVPPSTDPLLPIPLRPPEDAHPPRALLAAVFLDLVRSSDLSEAAFLAFGESVLGALADLLHALDLMPIHLETAGDGVVAGFSDIRDAAAFAREAASRIAAYDWASQGLPSTLQVRVSLHAGPAFRLRDPLTGQMRTTGHTLITAARLEAATPPGQVYATLPAACLLAAAEGRIGTYAGQITLPKGNIPVFSLCAALPLCTTPRSSTTLLSSLPCSLNLT